jgi:hypothetical protein
MCFILKKINYSFLKIKWQRRLITISQCDCMPYEIETPVMDQKPFSRYGALHRDFTAWMWSRPHTYNIITRHVVLYRSIGLLREIPLHYFITTSLNWALFKYTIRLLYSRGKKQRHPLKWRPGRADGFDGRLDTRQNVYSIEFRTTKFLIHNPLFCQFTEWTIAVSASKTNGTNAVDLCYGTYT